MAVSRKIFGFAWAKSQMFLMARIASPLKSSMTRRENVRMKRPMMTMTTILPFGVAGASLGLLHRACRRPCSHSMTNTKFVQKKETNPLDEVNDIETSFQGHAFVFVIPPNDASTVLRWSG